MNDNPERTLALSYAPATARAGLAALLALDDRLGSIVRTTREPMLGLMRLTWWSEALERLDLAPPPAEPVLAALAGTVLPRGVTGAALAAMVDGWEQLLGEAPLDAEALAAFGRERGARLFAAAAAVLGDADARVEQAGEGWALADLARRWSDGDVAAAARTAGRERLDGAFHRRWSRALRPLGALALLAQADLEDIPAGSPRRVARLAWHRLSGR